MKKLITILFICLLPFFSEATTYYISNLGSTGNNGTSASTPWPLSKVNSFTFSAGDNILFNRGETFYGSITASNSGNSGNPITYGAYGGGDNPVITGFTNVTSWTNLGNNIWESTNAVSTLPDLKKVVINNVDVPMGRYPNSDATYPFLPNYYAYQSHTGTGLGATSLTSNSLDGTNWTGADVVARANHWTMDKEPITASSGKTITYTGATAGTDGGGLEDGWGFFIQNDPRTLDVQNEWYYNPTTKKLRVYSSGQPSNVNVSTVGNLFYAGAKNYIAITNIDFKYANTTAIFFSSCDNATVTNCNIQYTGEIALVARDKSNYLKVDNCTFLDIGSAGIWSPDGGTNWTLTNNTFKRCALVSVIKPDDYTGGPIEIYAPYSLVQYNNIDSTAYEGIHFRGNNIEVRNNFVNHTSMLRDDGGGIYTGFPGSSESNKIIDGNIVLNSIGNNRGVGDGGSAGNGIYMDGLTNGATVTNNTVANVVSAGIFLNNDTAMQVHNNIVYNIGGQYWTKGALMVQTYNGAPFANYVRNNSVTNNIFFQKRSSQYNIFFYEASSGSNTIQNFGVLDSNIYVKATDNNLVNYDKYNANEAYLNLPGWQTASGQEAHGMAYSGNGSIDTTKIKFIYNPTKNDSTISLGAKYNDARNTIYDGSITLAPYRSAVLIYNSASSTVAAPAVSMSGSQSITTTSTSVYCAPSWASGHGGSVVWSKQSGPGTTSFSAPNSTSTTVSGLQNGAYVFRCTLLQDDGQTTFGEVTVTVQLPGGIFVGDLVQIYTSGSSITMGDKVDVLVVNPPSKVASLAITLPGITSYKNEVEIIFGGTIAFGNEVVGSITFLPGNGQTIMKPPSSDIVSGVIGAGTILRFKFIQSLNKWYFE